MVRKALKILLLALVVLLIAAAYTIHRLRTGPELRSEVLALPGLEAPVEVLYDSMGVPHLFASSLEDLFLAQGYVHARHRLWQMEMFRRVLQGRLSELFGRATVESDRFLRTIGLWRAAEAGTPPPGTPIRRQMERYAQGVNAAIGGWRGLLPPEFVLLRLKPEPWSAELSQGLEKIMAWDLSDYQTGLNLAAARAVLGDSALAPLLPRYPEWGVTIVDGWPEAAMQPGADAAAAGLPPGPDPSLLEQAAVPEQAEWLLELGSLTRASNSWVVGGERSRSGKPLLANDMHLALDAPNIWFLMGLHAPGYEVVGMSLPGAPGVVAGHSKAVAWGYTNAMVDDSDFFIEKVNPGDSSQYLTPEGWVTFEEREEVVHVRGAEPVTFTVRTTRHGPVVTPVEDRAGKEVLAFQWVAHAPANTFRALRGMGQARNAGEFLEALRDFDNPHQNVVFADTAGAWGYWMGGRVPVRASGTPPHLPVPGWTGEHDWLGWVPFEEKPHVLAPARGYVATANNAQGRDERARRVNSGGWAAPYRAQRISELIEVREKHDAASLLAIQMDPGSAFVERYRPHAVRAFREAGLDELAQRLEEWDAKATLESTEATLFHTWWISLRAAFRDAYYGRYAPARTGEAAEVTAREGGRGRGEAAEAAAREGGRGRSEAAEAADTENRPGSESGSPASGGDTLARPLPPQRRYFPNSVLERALDGELPLPAGLAEEAARAAALFADLPWGEAHQLTLDHPLGQLPVLRLLFGFGRSGIPRVGGPNSINVGPFSAQGGRGTQPPFRSAYGPSERHVVDLADPDGSGGFILPGGESGYPRNPHSFDQLELWRSGRLWLLPLARRGDSAHPGVEDRTVARVRLEPGG